MPKVSVIINCLNGERFVKSALESVYLQSFQDWEIIFLDNGSTDRSGEIALSFDSRLRYFRNDATVPLGQARNQALSKVSGEIVAFLDVDDVWLSRKLELQLPLFNRSQVGFVFADTELWFEASGSRVSYFKFHGYLPPKGAILPALLTHYSIPMLTAMVRASVLQGMPQWFDDTFQVCDDFDFFMRIASQWECDYLNEIVASCRIHSEAATIRFQRLGPVEMRKTLEKLKSADPLLTRNYPVEIECFNRKIDYQQAKLLWRDNEREKARQLFGKHLGQAKFFFSYLAAFFPLSVVKKFARRLT